MSGQVGPGFHAIMGEKGSLFGCSEGPCHAWQRRGNAPWPVPPRFELPRPTLGGGGGVGEGILQTKAREQALSGEA